MRNGLIVMLLVMVAMISTVVNAKDKEEPKVIADWITVTSYPKKVKIGDEAIIKVKLNGIPDGHFIGGDMHFFRGPSYGGFLVWAKPQKVEKGKEYTFTYKIGKKTDMTAVAVVFYVGEKAGYANCEKKIWLKGINVK